MQNLKCEMKPVVTDDGVTFKLKIEVVGSAVECEAIIKEFQAKSKDKSK